MAFSPLHDYIFQLLNQWGDSQGVHLCLCIYCGTITFISKEIYSLLSKKSPKWPELGHLTLFDQISQVGTVMYFIESNDYDKEVSYYDFNELFKMVYYNLHSND